MDTKSSPNKLRDFLDMVRYLPGIVMYLLLSAALGILGTGIIIALVIVVLDVPNQTQDIRKLTLPFIVGGVIILVLVILAFIMRAARSAGTAIPDDDVSSYPAPLPSGGSRMLQKQLPSGPVVEGSIASAPARTAVRSRSSAQPGRLVASGAAILAGLATVAISEIILATSGALGTLQIAAGLASGLGAAAIAYLLYRIVWRSRRAS